MAENPVYVKNNIFSSKMDIFTTKSVYLTIKSAIFERKLIIFDDGRRFKMKIGDFFVIKNDF